MISAPFFCCSSWFFFFFFSSTVLPLHWVTLPTTRKLLELRWSWLSPTFFNICFTGLGYTGRLKLSLKQHWTPTNGRWRRLKKRQPIKWRPRDPPPAYKAGWRGLCHGDELCPASSVIIASSVAARFCVWRSCAMMLKATVTYRS